MKLRNLLLCVVLGTAAAAPAGLVAVQSPPSAAADASAVALPNRDDSLKFAVLGDFGTGEKPQYQLADQMAKLYARFPFVLVTLVGDNLYGGQRDEDFKRKFEIPYKPLLSAGVKFYASLGNHDGVEQRLYPQFNMDGKRYYSFKAPKQDVRFFALESTYLTTEQIAWVETELRGSNEDWKIAFFHHPPYSSGEKHGSQAPIREALEPLFIKYNVSVVFTGHDHFYERIKPQNGVAYFVVGSGGKLRSGNIRRGSTITARGFDTDLAFLAAEINGDELVFNTISRAGKVIDSGTITRRK